MKFLAKHKILSLIIILLIALVGFRVYQYFTEEKETAETRPVNVKVETASLREISVVSPLTGRIEAGEDLPIIPMAQGQVTKVNVAIGDEVKAGDVLFEIDSSALAASYTAAANAYTRMKALYSEGAVSAQDLESVAAQYHSLSEQISYYKVTSPIDGYVTSLNVEVGSIAGASMAASVANTDSFKISTKISEAMAASVNVGDKVEVFVASADKTYSGTITAFSPVPGYGTLTYPMTITMDPDDSLMAGMFAEIHFISENIKDTLCVKSEAVILKDGRSVVAVLDENDIPTLVEVSTGLDNGELVQILSGLKKGDRVCWSGQQYITEGVAVKVVSEE